VNRPGVSNGGSVRPFLCSLPSARLSGRFLSGEACRDCATPTGAQDFGKIGWLGAQGGLRSCISPVYGYPENGDQPFQGAQGGYFPPRPTRRAHNRSVIWEPEVSDVPHPSSAVDVVGFRSWRLDPLALDWCSEGAATPTGRSVPAVAGRLLLRPARGADPLGRDHQPLQLHRQRRKHRWY
jgi:hypothetical protein